MRIETIDHVQLSVPVGSEEVVRAFYCGVLGLPELPKPEPLRARGGLWVAAGDRALHFGPEDVADRAASRRHVALVVADLAATRRRLEAAGLAIVDGIQSPGFVRLECRDPFGNRLEFLERRPAGEASACPALPGARPLSIGRAALDALAQAPVRFDALVGETDTGCVFVKTVTMADPGVATQRTTPAWPHHLPGELVISLTGEAGILTLRHKGLIAEGWRGHGVRIDSARFSSPVLLGETFFTLADVVRTRRIRESVHARFRFRMWKRDAEGRDIETYTSQQDAIAFPGGDGG